MEVNKKPLYGILVHSFPLFSTTFISDEIDLMRDQGVELKIYAVNPSKPGEYPPVFKRFFDETFYILPLKPLKLLQRNLSAFFKRPFAYLATLNMALFRGSLSIKDRLRTLIHFNEAIYLYPQLEKDQIKHIHAHFLMSPAAMAMFLKRYAGITYSITGHGTDIFVEKVMQAEKMKDAIFTRVATQYNKDFLLTQVKSEAKPKIEVIPIGIDEKLYTPKKLEPHSDRIEILHVGRLVWQKAQHFLIEMSKMLKEDKLNFHLTIVGEGPERKKIETLIADLGVGDVVTLTGAKSSQEIKSYYQNSDIFILCSISEGWSMVLLEAMASGLCAIGPTLNGIPEMIQDDFNGKLFVKGDVSSLCTACKEVMLNPQKRVEIAVKGTKVVHERYLNSNMVKRFLSYFP